jgi:hypothetical protein
MKNNVDILTEIPCFKCLFWDWKKESHLHCNPNECEELTKWLCQQGEKHKPKGESLTVVTTQHIKISEKAKP